MAGKNKYEVIAEKVTGLVQSGSLLPGTELCSNLEPGN